MKKILYKELVVGISDWIWVVDANGIYTYCSENVHDFLGFHSKDVIGKTPFDFMSEEEAQRVGEIFGSFVNKKEKIEKLVNTHIHKNGSEVIVETTAIPLFDDHGELLGYQGFDKDVTKQKNLESALEKQNNTFETLFEKSSDGILIIENNNIVNCNEKIIEMLRLNSKEELLNTHPSMLSPEYKLDGKKSFDEAEEMMNLAVEKSEHSFEWVHRRADGYEFLAEVILTPISLYDKDVIHVVFRDITTNKSMEEKLLNYTNKLETLNRDLDKRIKEEVLKNQEKDKQMFQQTRLAQIGEMISMIAHQWRQPLGAIASTLVNLQMKQELDFFDLDTKDGQKESKNYLLDRYKKIETYLQNLTNIIDDFKSFYKPNKETEESTLKEIVEKALYIIDGSMEFQGVIITTDCQDTRKFNLYKNEMMQVILSILQNSQENFREKKIKDQQMKITINQCGVTISDNGGGIPEDLLENIFDPYFSTKDEKNGTGLGLYMSKTIIEGHHKGKLTVSNLYDEKGVSTGACFKINLTMRCIHD